MLANIQRSRGWLVLLGLLIGAAGSTAKSGQAQKASDDGYAVTEAGGARQIDPLPSAALQENTGPVRLARFSKVQGNVTWRSDESTEWSTATLNLPLRQGAQIWVSEGGRAEVQFDDGSLLRLGTGAVVTLQTLFSDSDGEFTELKMTEGLASLRLRHDRGVYQVNTPLGSVKAAGPASLRIGVGNGLEVALKSGKATIEGAQGKADLQSGDYLDLANSNSPYTVRDIPRPDSWDRWNQDRDDILARAERQPAQEHLPADIAIVATNLDEYGTWRDDSQNGWVWCPRVTSSDWRPYNDGQWTWVNPFGWTWVANEAWGWAPYHYGTWVSRPYGWAWCPGPVNQYWSPAVVHFSECAGQVAWCPLAPSEVRYPASFGFGFNHGNWATYFAIGGAAVYYPTEYGYCAARPYNTTYVNRVTYINNVTNVTNVYNGGSNYGRNTAYGRFGLSQESYAVNNNTYLNGRTAFIPVNSRNAAGVTSVAITKFGGQGAYNAVARADTSLFTRGRAVAAPLQGRAPLAGPIVVQPTHQSMTPSRTFTAAPQAGAGRSDRQVYRAAVMPSIVRNSAPITSSGKVAARPQTAFVRQTVGASNSAGTTRNDRSVPFARTTSPGAGAGSATGTGSARTQVLPRGDGKQSSVTGRADTTQPKTGDYTEKRTAGNAVKGNSSAADAAAQARASLGMTTRTRPAGNASTGSGTTERTTRPTRDGGSNSAGTNGNSGEKTTQTYTPRQPQTYPPKSDAPRNESTHSDSTRNGTTRYEAPRNAPARTEPTHNDVPRSAPPRSEPTRNEVPYSAPQRTEPTRNEPPRNVPARNEPPRSEPTRSEPVRSEPRTSPPVREPEKTAPKKDSGPDKSSDTGSGSTGSSNSTNRGRPGRG